MNRIYICQHPECDFQTPCRKAFQRHVLKAGKEHSHQHPNGRPQKFESDAQRMAVTRAKERDQKEIKKVGRPKQEEPVMTDAQRKAKSRQLEKERKAEWEMGQEEEEKYISYLQKHGELTWPATREAMQRFLFEIFRIWIKDDYEFQFSSVKGQQDTIKTYMQLYIWNKKVIFNFPFDKLDTSKCYQKDVLMHCQYMPTEAARIIKLVLQITWKDIRGPGLPLDQFDMLDEHPGYIIPNFQVRFPQWHYKPWIPIYPLSADDNKSSKLSADTNNSPNHATCEDVYDHFEQFNDIQAKDFLEKEEVTTLVKKYTFVRKAINKEDLIFIYQNLEQQRQKELFAIYIEHLKLQSQQTNQRIDNQHETLRQEDYFRDHMRKEIQRHPDSSEICLKQGIEQKPHNDEIFDKKVEQEVQNPSLCDTQRIQADNKTKKRVTCDLNDDKTNKSAINQQDRSQHNHLKKRDSKKIEKQITFQDLDDHEQVDYQTALKNFPDLTVKQYKEGRDNDVEYQQEWKKTRFFYSLWLLLKKEEKPFIEKEIHNKKLQEIETMSANANLMRPIAQMLKNQFHLNKGKPITIKVNGFKYETFIDKIEYNLKADSKFASRAMIRDAIREICKVVPDWLKIFYGVEVCALKQQKDIKEADILNLIDRHVDKLKAGYKKDIEKAMKL